MLQAGAPGTTDLALPFTLMFTLACHAHALICTLAHTDAHTHAHTWCVHAHYMNGRVRLVFTGHRSQGKRELSVYLGSCSS